MCAILLNLRMGPKLFWEEFENQDAAEQTLGLTTFLDLVGKSSSEAQVPFA